MVCALAKLPCSRFSMLPHRSYAARHFIVQAGVPAVTCPERHLGPTLAQQPWRKATSCKVPKNGIAFASLNDGYTATGRSCLLPGRKENCNIYAEGAASRRVHCPAGQLQSLSSHSRTAAGCGGVDDLRVEALPRKRSPWPKNRLRICPTDVRLWGAYPRGNTPVTL